MGVRLGKGRGDMMLVCWYVGICMCRDQYQLSQMMAERMAQNKYEDVAFLKEELERVRTTASSIQGLNHLPAGKPLA